VEVVRNSEIIRRPISVSFLSNNKIVVANDSEGPFFRILFMLVLMVSDLQAATMKMREVLGVMSKPSFKEFCVFLKLAEVYGSGYLDDVEYTNFNLRSN
jgi:hypothetical protein